MNQDQMVSIVVAIYQVAPYLRECLESIRSQSYRNLEVILVDDGSDDGSEMICDEYGKMDGRFHVVHQKNQGTACARRNGAKAAQGGYIGFVDGDDWIREDMYEQLLAAAMPIHADAAICLRNIYRHQTGYSYAEDKVAEEKIYKKENGLNQICDYLFWGRDGHKEGISTTIGDKLFKRGKVIKYMEEIDGRLRYCEDSACVIPYLMDAETVCIVNQPLYNYRQRPGSACNSTDLMYLEQFNIFYQSIVGRLDAGMHEFKQRLDKYFVSRVYEGLNKMMNLSLKSVLPLHIPPIAKLPADERVVIYGAGVVGRDYHRMMELMCPDRIAGWVDRQWENLREEGLAVEPVRRLTVRDYDRIVVAALFEDSAKKIKEDLVSMGIEEARIFWQPPRTVLD